MIKAEATKGISYSSPSDVLIYEKVTLGSDFKEIECMNMDVASVQFSGLLDGATLSVLGSNDGCEYFTLHDDNGEELSHNRTGIFSVKEYVRFIKPSISGGTSETNVKISIYLRSAS